MNSTLAARQNGSGGNDRSGLQPTRIENTMLGFSLHARPDCPLRVLAIGAHADDIEIGCGGTILRLVDSCPDLIVRWVVLCGDDARTHEAQRSATTFLGNRMDSMECRGFRDGFLPYCGGEVKDYFESLKAFDPDLVLTHYRGDLHQDHRLACELTWNTFRNHLILEYEIPKYDGDIGTPNVFVPLSDEHAEKKIRLLLDNFPTQRGRNWFQADTFRGLMRLRGMECQVQGYAEAFYGRKVCITRLD